MAVTTLPKSYPSSKALVPGYVEVSVTLPSSFVTYANNAALPQIRERQILYFFDTPKLLPSQSSISRRPSCLQVSLRAIKSWEPSRQYPGGTFDAATTKASHRDCIADELAILEGKATSCLTASPYMLGLNYPSRKSPWESHRGKINSPAGHETEEQNGQRDEGWRTRMAF